MRRDAAEIRAKKGQKLVISCSARRNAFVSIWGETELGRGPYVPLVPPVSKGKPQIVTPLYKRFESKCRFEIYPREDIKLIVVEEADTEDDFTETRLKVRMVKHGKLRQTISKIGRGCRNALRAICGKNASARPRLR